MFRQSEYDFQTPQQAIGEYRSFLHSLLPQKEADATTLAKEICSWQELSDTIYNSIQQDPSFTEHFSLPLEFQLITDSVRSEFIRLSENCSLRDVAYVKLHTYPFRRDSALNGVKQEAASFFDSMDKQPAATFANAHDFMKSYQSFLESTQASGISTKSEFLVFLQQEDLLFRTFLLHLDECSDVGASAITQLTAEISASIWKDSWHHQRSRVPMHEGRVDHADTEILFLIRRKPPTQLAQLINQFQKNCNGKRKQQTKGTTPKSSALDGESAYLFNRFAVERKR